jgi:predicted flap endonuclease-1-like 5' DNA nuclease
MLSAFFTCYLWWFLAGVLLGWLANWLLCKAVCKTSAHTHPETITTGSLAHPLVNPHVKAEIATLATLPMGAKAVDVKATTALGLDVIGGLGASVSSSVSSSTHATTATVSNLVSSVVGGVTAVGVAATKATSSVTGDASAAVNAHEATIDVAAAKLAGIIVKDADDLEVIEGIGPKICALFHAAGQKTFTQVSKMSIADMSTILDNAGARFKLANPETWAQQAQLAAHNQWTDLKALQDKLTAGVTVQQDRSEL